MKIRYVLIIGVIFLSLVNFSLYSCDPATQSLQEEETVEFLVVGAGVGGLSAIGVLHHVGIPYKKLAWVDPEFNVGRIGEFYATVPANNITAKFIDFINACSTFQECTAPSLDELRAQEPNEFPELGIIIPALKDITAYIRTKLVSHQGWLQGLHFADDAWCAHVNNKKITARHVILAIGSHPRELSYENVSVIPLDHALDKAKLATYVTPDSTIGVIGGSHSGILVLKYLYELEVKKIINLYRSPIVYTTDAGGWYMNAYDGLKGLTAQWAREVLQGPNPPANIVRALNTDENRAMYLSECNKIIYSVGYERNDTPLVGEYAHAEYDDRTGVIAPRLFGIGIAFPEYYCDPCGITDHRVGLTSFMDYAQRIIPQWIASSSELTRQNYQDLLYRRRTILAKFEELFTIHIL